ncbi:MAG: NADH-quinone oxidoreductase subunit J [Candidatus Zixiibacteriota bacterium]
MTIDSVIFAISAIVAVFGATMMVSVRNPVAAVLYLIVSLVAQSVLYIQLSALFVAAVLIIVYAGAILVLFLFVIMLLNLRGTEELGEHSKPISRFVKCLAATLITVELIFAFKSGLYSESAGAVIDTNSSTFGSASEVGRLMFTKYVYAFELTGVLLLAAVVGAVVIAKRDPDEIPAGLRSTTDSDQKPRKVGG